MANFSNYGFRLHTTAEISAILFGGVTDLGHILNSEVATPETGDAFAESQSLVGQMPVLPIRSQSIEAILTNIGLTGKCIDSDGTHPGLTIFAQRHDPCAVGARSASANLSVTFGRGHLFLETVEAGGIGSNVEANLRCHGITADGATAPFAVAYNVTLPSGRLISQYGLGKPTILGTVLHKIQSQSISYGVNFQKPNDVDTIWPSEIDPANFDFQTTIVARAPELLDAGIPSTGQHTDDDTILRFIKRVTAASEAPAASNGGFVDFTAEEHITGAATGLVYVEEHYNASGRATGLTQIRIAGYQGAAVPVVWDPTAAYDLS
jgi:hypothetical protein